MHLEEAQQFNGMWQHIQNYTDTQINSSDIIVYFNVNLILLNKLINSAFVGE